MKKIIITLPLLFLTGCLSTGNEFSKVNAPNSWSDYQVEIIQKQEVQELGEWWKKFNDPILNQLIALSFSESPERRIAETRILEARGIRRTARASLFPSVSLSGSAGRQDDGLAEDDFYDAAFDASYEIDLFGQNRKTVKAANENIRRLEAQYYNVTLTMISEITRDYVDYRRFQTQASIAEQNLAIQEKTLELVRNQKEFGEAPQLDVERAENLVNTTKASVPEFSRLAKNARLRLSVLVGQTPDQIDHILEVSKPIPSSEVKPVLLAPSEVIALRPDIRAATSNLIATTALAEAATAELFPTISVSGLFGVVENALIDSTSVWNIALNAAVSLIDFGRIEGTIDSARAIEQRAYEQYRLTVLQAATEVETALNNYAHVNKQYVHINQAYNNADKALNLSQLLYKEGEVSFINVLEAQRTLNEAQAALVDVEASKVQSLIGLYKSLGVY